MKRVDLVLFLVHAMEHSGNSEKLKRAAHREALVCAVLEAPAVARVESSNAQATADTLFDSRESVLRGLRT